jgi:hypothetical protein
MKRACGLKLHFTGFERDGGADSCAGELVSNAEMSLGAADTSVCATSIQKAVDFGG